MSNINQLDNTIPVFCTARIPPELLNEFLAEAFEASELKDVECTHIAILVDTTDINQLTEPTRPPVKEKLQYPFLNWSLDDLVNFARQFDRTAHGIIDTEFVILDEQTLKDKTVVLVTPSEMSNDIETAPRLTARSDFRSSLITLNVKSIGVGGDEPWEEAAQNNSVIRLYGENPGAGV
ncbi:hypothetical protein PtrSN002B_002215 [Pyrenophora tritici-repentis]|uniref:Uncharacterized protein n=2 Tax=Pyrenophora tritici-repentis TaxID=45151 RepID=A0A2W1GYB8_9PLEO|nr:uncharacterized protein PTRG_04348 [Pyrenophora tritici-repentis Pt-1C-BFP]KAA8619560.1 hypothetical protein PtrV1_06654 [Pyrenophora tritici-repentis]EDU47186.1 hypothetical protein PTRG_04348 [Pyrenophora tritici-repentis Pt-1C-BFP]KAF7447704.1 hypothetical protein A1F99_070680 [Pyrenophora tritici-repentis]KAF7571394.1 hypothetical protein PtrM4_088940 [Pyrenophora tritici-repentis]KAG9385368.1 hypothetical protein A1F94_004915 [Pyrenophora tritici-repentis]